ncbi:NLR family CARD domain-containing protein 3 [Labeo rohita]|uniref:NLR family CARD domain-containing protein 3 n=1 Tax=Labeo rohita TaxID=84645 RepID=A0ABQ8L757_LABRO|nr:NLR family CARD domain-containing protein 3 [Labeo rohita]
MSGHEKREDEGTASEMCSGSNYVSMSDENISSLPSASSDTTVTSDRSISRKKQRSESSEPSGVSVKSDSSMMNPPELSGAGTSDPFISRKKQIFKSPEPSGVSVKSDSSMMNPPELSGAVTSDPLCGEIDELIRSVPSSTFYYKNHIRQNKTEAVLQTHALETKDLQRIKDHHKTSMNNKYNRLFEGTKLQENQTLLLYIIEGESEGVNEEHEVLQMEKTARTKHSQDTPIYCNDIFKSSPEPGCIAGIGKTVSVQKFILDWAEGKANQDVDFMFLLPFRELNLIRDHRYSFHRLLLDFHPELQDLDSKIYEECKVVFIFDGLDESRITLMFSDDQKVCDVTETSSVGVLKSNLMKGELLPSALIWITSRPAAANQIPSKYINRLTEIQGFNEPQKEEYFRKRISDQHQASRIISHIRRTRSLHICMFNKSEFVAICWSEIHIHRIHLVCSTSSTATDGDQREQSRAELKTVASSRTLSALVREALAVFACSITDEVN